MTSKSIVNEYHLEIQTRNNTNVLSYGARQTMYGKENDAKLESSYVRSRPATNSDAPNRAEPNSENRIETDLNKYSLRKEL